MSRLRQQEKKMDMIIGVAIMIIAVFAVIEALWALVHAREMAKLDATKKRLEEKCGK